MAYHEEVASWFFINRKAFDLRIDECSWTKEWLPKFFDLRVRGRFRQNEVVGSGIATTPELALQIAFSEFTERSVCVVEGFSSYAVASHVTAMDARKAAYAEMVERHAVSYHHFLSIGGRKCSADELSSDFAPALVKLAQSELKIETFELTRYGRLKTFLAIGKDLRQAPRFGAVFGSASAESGEQALKKAFLECLVNVVSEFESPMQKKLSLREFYGLGTWSAKDHVALYRHPSLAGYSVDESAVAPAAEIRANFIELKMPEEFRGLPLIIVRARSSYAYGDPTGPSCHVDCSRYAEGSAAINFDRSDLPLPKG